MATLTITVPNTLVPECTTIAERYLSARGITIAGMTATQKGQRYIAELLKVELVKLRREAAEASGQTSVETARDTADEQTRAAIVAAQADAEGITG